MQNGNGGRGRPWGSGAKPGSDLEDLIGQGQDPVRGGRLSALASGSS